MVKPFLTQKKKKQTKQTNKQTHSEENERKGKGERKEEKNEKRVERGGEGEQFSISLGDPISSFFLSLPGLHQISLVTDECCWHESLTEQFP